MQTNDAQTPAETKEVVRRLNLDDFRTALAQAERIRLKGCNLYGNSLRNSLNAGVMSERTPHAPEGKAGHGPESIGSPVARTENNLTKRVDMSDGEGRTPLPSVSFKLLLCTGSSQRWNGWRQRFSGGKSLQGYFRGLASSIRAVTEAQDKTIWERSL
jgi:hypothetical protein